MMLRIRGWLRALFRRAEVEDEMHAEMQMHLDRAVERLMARGLSERDARVQARREFGNIGYIQEEARDARGVRWIDDTMQDVRFGVRSLVKTPGFTLVVMLSLVLGIGVNTAIFTMLKVALRPGTIDQPETFVSIPGRWSKPAYDELRANAPAFSAVMARSSESVLLAPRASGEDPVRAGAELVSENFFPSLHAPIALGRALGPQDARVPVAVLNHRFWKSRFNSDSGVVGKQFRLASGVTYTVIGVASRDFTGIRRGGPDFWVPYAMRPTMAAVYQLDPGMENWLTDSRAGWLDVYARLAPEHTLAEARVQVDLVLRRLAAADTAFAPGWSAELLQLTTAEGGLNGPRERLAALTVMAATTIVLLVACFNVASLMLARATDRQHEIAVRLSLGASRRRIIRQLLTESTIVAQVSALGAVAVSMGTLRVAAASGALASIASDEPERLVRLLSPDGWVLGFALVLSMISAVVCGLAPAIRATRFDLTDAMKANGSATNARSRLRSGLVAGQVALALVLLVSAGVLLRSFVRARSLDTGFERAQTLVVETSLRQSGYDSARAATYTRMLEERIAALPGTRSIARGDLPLVQRARAIIKVDGKATSGYYNGVTPSFFDAFSIPIVRGRAFTDDELRAKTPVVVVTEATARTLWGNDDPLGKHVTIAPVGKAARQAPIVTSGVVVGVARDAQLVELGRIPLTYAFVPEPDGSLVVRAVDATRTVAGIRDAARSIDANALVTTTPLDELIFTRTAISGVQVAAVFAGAIGALALVLAAIGIFGLTAYSVSRRTRELGIRRALGARESDVVALVLRDGMHVIMLGAFVGVLLGAAATRVFASLLFGMSPIDPLAYGGVAVVLVIVAAIACFVPARRAAKVDPLIALRAE